MASLMDQANYKGCEPQSWKSVTNLITNSAKEMPEVFNRPIQE